MPKMSFCRKNTVSDVKAKKPSILSQVRERRVWGRAPQLSGITQSRGRQRLGRSTPAAHRIDNGSLSLAEMTTSESAPTASERYFARCFR